MLREEMVNGPTRMEESGKRGEERRYRVCV